ncbi:hypothetical protein DEO72_LG10g1560 [Vigna unguiculata]|uniref:Uncharacterized protein n=1 Tax=Vigna unguiculata TaxID=3917 RepID=A0A4D6N911_VIGUN|nr:hypothetical protein DEO72_LG10g1560 [Vigna unguiculata]
MRLLLKVCLRWLICKKSDSSDLCALELSNKFYVPVGILLIKKGRQCDEGSGGPTVGIGRILMETITKVREDPLEKIAESSWPTKTGRDVSRDIVSLERVSVVERVCHSQEGAADKFFYMYMCHFSQLHAFLYFYDTRPRQPTTWLSLVSRPSISRLDAFTQAFKYFKDGFFKVVVKQVGRSYFYNDDGSTKFPFSWTNNPWRYKDMKIEKLSVVDKEVVETLMKFNDRMPTKGLVRFYNSVHPIVDIEGHLAQLGKKNLTFFQTLRKEKATKAKASGSTKLEAGLIELPETIVRRDMDINLSETLVNSINNMDPNPMVKAMVEFNSKALIMGRRVRSMLERELKEDSRSKVEELQSQVDKHAKEKAA